MFFFKSSFAFLLFLLGATTISNASEIRVPLGYTSAHLRVFWQDYLNITDFIMILGLTDLGTGVSPIGGPFGTMIVFDDPLTLTAERDSKIVGSLRGTGSVCAADGLTTCWAFTVKLTKGKYKGSVMFSSTVATDRPDIAPIIGGVGDFLFAQGYAHFNPIDVKTTNTTTIVDLNVFWPPFKA